VDTQSPHAEDEVYYVVRGRGRFTADGDEMDVEAGAVLFVAAGVEHRFHSIGEDLEILVFFARR
jgi:mannose-6-phosphate isomerase-like protein (cupin superfamily)